MTSEQQVGMLPGGYWDDEGRLHREVTLRALTGHEEELLAGSAASPAELVSLVLSRCVLRIGHLEAVTLAVTRRLLIADRDYLLLLLRRLSFGDGVRADLICPWSECGERVTIEFDLSRLPVHDPPQRAALQRLSLARSAEASGEGSDGDELEVWFRLPNGSDQEELSPWAAGDEAAATTALLQRCIDRIGADRAVDVEAVRRLPAAARARIEAEMQRLAPSLERTIETRCAECGRVFVAPFDLHRFFFGELRTDRDLLYREVHYLAYHYHWSEPEIMGMPRSKRRTYIEVLGEEIERLNSAV